MNQNQIRRDAVRGARCATGTDPIARARRSLDERTNERTNERTREPNRSVPV